MRVNSDGRDMGLHGLRQGPLEKGGSTGNVIRVVVGEGVVFDLGGKGIPVGIPVCTGIIMDKFRGRVKARVGTGTTTV